MWELSKSPKVTEVWFWDVVEGDKISKGAFEILNAIPFGPFSFSPPSEKKSKAPRVGRDKFTQIFQDCALQIIFVLTLI